MTNLINRDTLLTPNNEPLGANNMKVIYRNSAEALVFKNNKYYAIRYDGMYDFYLIFDADSAGNITNWTETGTAEDIDDGIRFVKRWR